MGGVYCECQSHDVVLDGVTAPAVLHVQSLAWCAIALIAGSLVFKKSQDTFILKI